MRRSLHNERRAPRVPLRVWATIEHRGREWRVETEDVGPGGCLVRSDRNIITGLGLRILLQVGAVPIALSAEGTVAWSQGPRAGIAFDPGVIALRTAAWAWFRRLLAADPRLGQVMARAPAEVDLEAPVFLMPPPRIVDLSADEALLVGHAEHGIAVGALLSRAGIEGPRAAHLLFGLLEKRVFTLSVGEAGDGWKWRAALAGAGHALPRDRAKRDPSAPPVVKRAAAPAPTTLHGTPESILPRATAAPPAAPPATAARARYEPGTAAVVMARLLRGVGSSQRPPEAEAALVEARSAEAAGRVADAIKLLRQALALAPQDREISGVLARLAFRNPVE